MPIRRFTPREPSSVPEAQAMARVRAMRLALLSLHKAVIEVERVRYQSDRGAIESPHAFLSLLMQDPFFAWVRPLAQIIVQIDEWLDADGPHSLDAAATLAVEVRGLLSGDVGGEAFRRDYQRLLQESPEVVIAHGRVVAMLAA